MGRTTSRLGAEVEAAIVQSGLFEVVREPVQYMCFFRSRRSGAHFAIERVTESHINVWLCPTEGIVNVLRSEGISTSPISRPYPYREAPNKYGRIASLKSDGVLRNAELLCVPVTSGQQALRVLYGV